MDRQAFHPNGRESSMDTQARHYPMEVSNGSINDYVLVPHPRDAPGLSMTRLPLVAGARAGI